MLQNVTLCTHRRMSIVVDSLIMQIVICIIYIYIYIYIYNIDLLRAEQYIFPKYKINSAIKY